MKKRPAVYFWLLAFGIQKVIRVPLKYKVPSKEYLLYIHMKEIITPSLVGLE